MRPGARRSESLRRRWGLGRLRRLGRARGLGSGAEPLLDVAAAVAGGARAVGGADHGLLAPAQQAAQRPEPGGDRRPHVVGAGAGHPARRQRGGHRRRVDCHAPRRDVDDEVLLAAARGGGAPGGGAGGDGERQCRRRRGEAGVGDVVVGAPEEDVGGEHDGELDAAGGGVLAGQGGEVVGGGDGGAAERAGVVGVEPHVDALHVEGVGALGQRAHLLAVGHLRQAHRALQPVLVFSGGGGGGGGGRGGGGVDGDGEGPEGGDGEAAGGERGGGDEEEAGRRRGGRHERVGAQVALGVEVEEEDEDDHHEEEDHRGQEDAVADCQLLLPGAAARGGLDRLVGPQRRRVRCRRRWQRRRHRRRRRPGQHGFGFLAVFLAWRRRREEGGDDEMEKMRGREERSGRAGGREGNALRI
ncbi:unnamed protein product [Urochloa decumbens]|uniref:Uncharacterized protein n=1 Tax=Urochloa decumbens TaxID=240449 RepID=A0ABC9DSX7_9POAL